MTVTNNETTPYKCAQCQEFNQSIPFHLDISLSYYQGTAGEVSVDVDCMPRTGAFSDLEIDVSFKINGETVRTQGRPQFNSKRQCKVCEEKKSLYDCMLKKIEEMKSENDLLKQDITRMKGKERASEVEIEEEQDASHYSESVKEEDDDFCGFSFDFRDLENDEDDAEEDQGGWKLVKEVYIISSSSESGEDEVDRSCASGSAVGVSNSNNKLYLPSKRRRVCSNDDQ